MTNYESMTADEIQQELYKIGEERDRLRELSRDLIKLRDKKLAEDTIKVKFDAMSDAEKEALTQYVNVTSIGAKSPVERLIDS